MDIVLERILSLIPQKENGRFLKGAAAEFAEKINVAPNLPAEWKAGRNKSYRTKLRDISVAYGVSVEWLLGETDEKTPPADAESERAKLLASLENMSKDELIAFHAAVKKGIIIRIGRIENGIRKP